MDDVYRNTMLVDIYGKLLTERQYETLDLYYNNDYSLGEIASHMGISRQGVYDNIRRSKKVMRDFEDKLGLVDSHLKWKKGMEAVLAQLRSINRNKIDYRDKKVLKNIEKNLLNMLK